MKKKRQHKFLAGVEPNCREQHKSLSLSFVSSNEMESRGGHDVIKQTNRNVNKLTVSVSSVNQFLGFSFFK